ncbi:efflux transporter outer membrane subunit [Flavobacterium paronense]|uniref:TolC family protein n=1 Tax=Flavobacterium paronense TaxID=1392775 RepID=A0ABV5GE64_9FLAO|nr:efflux transporter outer membrane subunit [Flavobacterium paronense]MDN3678231.1 efflux transporter outer membrane subunit [Flavobacterium paronense]
MLNKIITYRYSVALGICLVVASCSPAISTLNENKAAVPASFDKSTDTTNTSTTKWRTYFKDANLVSLIDSALKNNQELEMTLQEIEIARNDVRVKKGLLLPMVTAGVGAGVDKVGRYTSAGAGDASTDITPGKEVPEVLQDYGLGLHAVWEVDIWKKLHNAKKAAFTRYLATIEGKNFVVTNLVAEIANSYYELLSYDNQLDIIQQTITLQKNALEIVKAQKEAARANELGVKKFEAEVFNSQSREFQIQQQIKETENKINFLLGRYPQPISRDKTVLISQLPQQIQAGIPSQLLANRPDIKQAELELFATKCDVKAAKAEFYPSFTIAGGIGFNAFKPSYLFTSPESLIYNLVGDLTAPLINRNAIKAEFNKAKAEQLKALYNYQKTVLNGYIEVSNELSNIKNLEQFYDLKNKEVQSLTTAIDASNDLFKASRVDYFEVLMTQRDALESKLELIEAKKEQFNAVTNVYRALGGGWN